jgi:DNA-binding SARP family transcriptional activator
MTPRLEIRLLGGFEVRFGAQVRRGFESQKVRALLAYLACHRGQPQDRAHLAGLLWPEEDARTGRQNLRQAAYNLRRSLGDPVPGRPDYLTGSHQSLQLDPEADVWLDITAFEQAAKRGLKSGIETDVSWLTEAASLYRGHLLPAFAVKDSEEFENWLWDKREQLRELAVRNLRVLTSCHLENGDYALGIDHGRTLVELDPLSEEAHRTLIHLYFLAGRRSQALLEYEAFAKRLETELDVKPLSETTALYESILTDSAPGPPTASRPDPIGPFVTLEGRDAEMDRLLTIWREVVGGASRVVLIDGASGVGKSRLVKTFLHVATSESRGTVLRCRAYSLSPPLVFGPVIELLRNAWRVGQAGSRQRFHRLPLAQLNLVRELLPGLGELEILEAIDPVGEIEAREALYDAITAFILTSSGPEATRQDHPLLLFLDDAQWADPASLDYLVHLLGDEMDTPLLLVMTCRTEHVGPEQAAAIDILRGLPNAQSMTLESVGPAAVRRMVDSVAEADDRAALAAFLQERSNGQPLLITETINYLCDLGYMVAGGGTRWRLTREPRELAEQIPRTATELIRRRIARLPSSTRRLLAHAALIGQRFDFTLLRRAADEHALVVETAIGLMLEHWLGRQFPDAWASTHQERDIVLWAQGARRGTFEFAHKAIRQALHEGIPDERRPLLHRDVAEAIERTASDRLEEYCEELAYHYLRAEAWSEAVIYLRQAAERAANLRADQSALSYCVDALRTIERLQETATNRSDRTRWARLGRDLEALRKRVEQRLGSDALSRYPSLSIAVD